MKKIRTSSTWNHRLCKYPTWFDWTLRLMLRFPILPVNCDVIFAYVDNFDYNYVLVNLI